MMWDSGLFYHSHFVVCSRELLNMICNLLVIQYPINYIDMSVGVHQTVRASREGQLSHSNQSFILELVDSSLFLACLINPSYEVNVTIRQLYGLMELGDILYIKLYLFKVGHIRANLVEKKVRFAVHFREIV